MLKEEKFVKKNSTNPRYLAKDYRTLGVKQILLTLSIWEKVYRTLGVIWMRRRIVEKLVPVCRFNIEIYQKFTI